MARNRINNAIVQITARDLVSCKRCGCGDLAWVKFKSGKWGLVTTCVDRPFYRGDGPTPVGLFACKFNFHRCDEYLAMLERIRLANEFKPVKFLDGVFKHLLANVVSAGVMATGFSSTPMHPDCEAIKIVSDALAQIPREERG